MSRSRLRWILWRPGAPFHHGAEELVGTPCTRAVAALDSSGLKVQFYVSKHGPSEAWFTVLCDTALASQVAALVEPTLDPYPRRSDHLDDPSREPLLQPGCALFLLDLETWTRMALEIHAGENRAAVQRSLVISSRGHRADRHALEQLLTQGSQAYSSLVDKDGLWQRATTACIPDTDAIHWLYNVVLGLDDFTGRAPAAEFLQTLGVSPSAA